MKGNTRYAVGWAVGGWFVPIVHLYMPYQIMQELFRGTKQVLLDANPSNAKRLPRNLVGIWWTLAWCPILPSIVLNLSLHIPISLTIILIFSYMQIALNCVIPLMTIKLIYDYSKMEKLLSNV
jgi:hypothetical protein